MRRADEVKVDKNVLIPMRDGIRLAADLYLPDPSPDEPLPVVMEYIPYRKDEVPPGSRFYEYLPRQGYIVARVDIRGTGGSEGINTDEYVEQEQLDGYDAIEWLAAQPFCDGHVNQMGISYGGFTSLQVATHQPPHLTSIVPMYFTDDRYTDDCHYRGGHLRKYYDIGHYGNFMIAYNALPPYPEWSGADWATIWEEHIARNEPYLLNWLKHQTNGPYWRHGSVRDVADRITCPVFMIGGWRDGYPNPPLRLYQALTAPKKVLIGPWNHAVPDVAIPGPGSTISTRWSAGSTTGAKAGRPGSWTSRRSSSTCNIRSRRSSTVSRQRASGGLRRAGPLRGPASARCTWRPADYSPTSPRTTEPTRSSTSPPSASPAVSGQGVSSSGSRPISVPTRRSPSSTRRHPSKKTYTSRAVP